VLAGLKAANHQCAALPTVAEAATSSFTGELALADYNKAATSTFPTVENAAQSVLMNDLQCGCQGLADYTSGDGDCKRIIAELGKLKAAYTNHQNLSLTKPTKNPLVGQVSLGGVCYSDVQLAYVPDQSILISFP
jgi:hypothetical protein